MSLVDVSPFRGVVVSAPLSSVKILDFSTLLPGPFASMMLADLGADVIRVEAPPRPGALHMAEPDKPDPWQSLLGRSKRSIVLDLKNPLARPVVERLIATHDVVLEQFRPGVMDRLGVGYEALRAANPAVIYCSISSFGQAGPFRDRAAHDINALALAGVMAHSGSREGGPPNLGVQLADIGSSFLAVTGILAAIHHRRETGVGQRVDVDLFGASMLWNALAAGSSLVAGVEPARESSLLNGGTVYGFYETSDGGYLSVGSLEPKFWSRFCAVIERPDLEERRGAPDAPGQEPLRAEIQAVIGSRTLKEWTELFASQDACVEPVLSVSEALEHPQTAARKLVTELPDRFGGSQRQMGLPIEFSASPPQYRFAGGSPGLDTVDVMAELGYDQADQEEMRRAGVFGAAPPPV